MNCARPRNTYFDLEILARRPQIEGSYNSITKVDLRGSDFNRTPHLGQKRLSSGM